MNFVERLNSIRIAFEEGDTPQEIVDILNSHVQKLIDTKADRHVLSVGRTAPVDFVVQEDYQPVALEQYLGERYTVLTWFRGNW